MEAKDNMWLQIDIYNILLDFLEEDKAQEAVEAIIDRIDHPEHMSKEL